MAKIDSIRKMLRSGIDISTVKPDFEPNFGIDPETGTNVFWRFIRNENPHYTFRLGGAGSVAYLLDMAEAVSAPEPEQAILSRVAENMGVSHEAHLNALSNLTKKALEHYKDFWLPTMLQASRVYVVSNKAALSVIEHITPPPLFVYTEEEKDWFKKVEIFQKQSGTDEFSVHAPAKKWVAFAKAKHLGVPRRKEEKKPETSGVESTKALHFPDLESLVRSELVRSRDDTKLDIGTRAYVAKTKSVYQLEAKGWAYVGVAIVPPE